MICNHCQNARREQGATIPDPCRHVETYNAIVAGESIPKCDAYCALVREHAKHASTMLNAFGSDLIVHDRNLLADTDNDTSAFCWILSPSHTVTIFPCLERGAWRPSSIPQIVGKADKVYLWEGGRLRETTIDGASEWLGKALARLEEKKERAA